MTAFNAEANGFQRSTEEGSTTYTGIKVKAAYQATPTLIPVLLATPKARTMKKMTNINIRAATVDDLEALTVLNCEVQSLHHQLRPTIFKAPKPEEIQENLYGCLQSEIMRIEVAEETFGKIVGYVLVTTKPTKESWSVHVEKYLMIDQLCVTEQYRRKGIGRLLLKKVKEVALTQGVRTIELSVWCQNSTAYRFFKGNGYREKEMRMEMQLE